MYLRDIVICADDSLVSRFRGGFVHRFSRQASCVVDHFLSLIQRKIGTESYAKIVIEMIDQKSSSSGAGNPTGVLIKWPFDFDQYVHSDVLEKKQLLLTSLEQAVTRFGTVHNWNVTPIANACATIRSRAWQFEGITKRRWSDPTKKWAVAVHFDHDLDEVRLAAVLYRARQSIAVGRVSLGVGVPGYDCLRDYTTVGHWVRRTQFELLDQSFLKQRWTADLSSLIASVNA